MRALLVTALSVFALAATASTSFSASNDLKTQTQAAPPPQSGAASPRLNTQEETRIENERLIRLKETGRTQCSEEGQRQGSCHML